MRSGESAQGELGKDIKIKRKQDETAFALFFIIIIRVCSFIENGDMQYVWEKWENQTYNSGRFIRNIDFRVDNVVYFRGGIK